MSTSGSSVAIPSAGEGLPVRRGPRRGCLRLPDDAEIIESEGGNHARFGDYGVQSGDGTATIGSDEMRTILTDDITAFLQEV